MFQNEVQHKMSGGFFILCGKDVYCMTVYAVSLNSGGLSGQVLFASLREMWLEYVIVFLLVFFGVSRLALKLARRLFDPAADKPIFFILAVQCFTVMCVVPVITLAAAFIHGGTQGWFIRWISTAAVCFPAALILQVFFIGPLVRWVFGKILG